MLHVVHLHTDTDGLTYTYIHACMQHDAQGDAIHAFPPDLGAGVNSAFEDVMDFIFSLDRADGACACACV